MVTLITPLKGAQTFLRFWSHQIPAPGGCTRTELLMARARGSLWVDKEIGKRSDGLEIPEKLFNVQVLKLKF